MDINKLRIFVNLVETENFTRTAQNLNLTQPSVSYIIKSIEDETGQKLFVRNKRHVVPTKNGLIFYLGLSFISSKLKIGFGCCYGFMGVFS